MPFRSGELIEGTFDESQRRDMASKVTQAMVDVGRENMRPLTCVVIEEIKSGDRSIGGALKAAADVKALAVGAVVG